MQRHPPEIDFNEPRQNRQVFESPDALAEYRCSVLETVGLDYGFGLLYSAGFTEGLSDGLPASRSFAGFGDGHARMVGPPIAMVFRPEIGTLDTSFTGALSPCVEAAVHLREYPHAKDPVCLVTAGYSAGWYSAVLGETILVREVSCVACGDDACRFEARRLTDWAETDEAWTGTILPYLDLEKIRQRATEHGSSSEAEAEAEFGNMMGSFDPMSPAVHVWGPVMVLPYSGIEDGIAALEAVRSDTDAELIRVVVVDTSGVRIDSSEAVDLTHLLDALESQGVETVVVGLSGQAAQILQLANKSLALPLLAGDISGGIALGFQLCLFSPDSQ